MEEVNDKSEKFGLIDKLGRYSRLEELSLRCYHHTGESDRLMRTSMIDSPCTPCLHAVGTTPKKEKKDKPVGEGVRA